MPKQMDKVMTNKLMSSLASLYLIPKSYIAYSFKLFMFNYEVLDLF
ncbi:MAG: hypothetical protein CM15mP87_11170 [Candidatus Neomarinimicrobiota bacterium]|nr:MAG: hypothetical protein CM15mP87_11170 [Candidatus Neomarinimicrobiota bacterium]